MLTRTRRLTRGVERSKAGCVPRHHARSSRGSCRISAAVLGVAVVESVRKNSEYGSSTTKRSGKERYWSVCWLGPHG
eukprot:1528035-Pyramimonas_sp.AAC.1